MASKKPIDYQKLNSELDQILADLESEDLDIDKAIKKYERGMAIVAELKNYLKQSTNKVNQLKKKFTN